MREDVRVGSVVSAPGGRPKGRHVVYETAGAEGRTVILELDGVAHDDVVGHALFAGEMSDILVRDRQHARPAAGAGFGPGGAPTMPRAGRARRVRLGAVPATTDMDCAWDHRLSACAPAAACAFRPRDGDLTLSQGCRLEERVIQNHGHSARAARTKK